MSTAVAAVAAAGLVIAVLVFVAWPFVVPESQPVEPALSEVERRRLAAAERRDEAYVALQELEQDIAAGKVTAEDSRLERSRLRAEAAAALQELDALEFPNTEVGPRRIDGWIDVPIYHAFQGQGQQGARQGRVLLGRRSTTATRSSSRACRRSSAASRTWSPPRSVCSCRRQARGERGQARRPGQAGARRQS